MDVVLSTEIMLLGWSAVLLLLQVVAQASASGDLGPKYLFSVRDEELQTSSVLGRRLDRALKNLLETYPAFVALALALAMAGRTGGYGEIGAWIYLVARVIYVILYAMGIPVIRTVVWLASMVGMAMMAWQLLG